MQSTTREKRSDGPAAARLSGACRRLRCRGGFALPGDLVAQDVALHLAGRGLRQLGDEIDPAWILHRRERRLDVRFERPGQLRAGLLARVEHHEGVWLDQPVGVGVTDDRRLQYAWMRAQRR